jgi:hypothetical protein
MIREALLVEGVDVRLNDTSKLLEANFRCRSQQGVVSIIAQEASPKVVGVTEDVIPLVLSITDPSLKALITPTRDLTEMSDDELERYRSGLEIALDESLRASYPRYHAHGELRTPVLFVEHE